MKKIAVLTLIATFMVACNKNTPPVSKAKEEPKPTVQGVKGTLASLDAVPLKEGVLAAAKMSGACEAFHHYRQYVDLQSTMKVLVTLDQETLDHTQKKLDEAGKAAAEAGYKTMVSGLTYGCKLYSYGPEDNWAEVDSVKTFARMINRYSIPADSKIIRAAYQKAAQAQISRDLDIIKDYPHHARALGNLRDIIRDAKYEWHFNLDELGIPADIANKYQ
jgi:hypothetical protein